MKRLTYFAALGAVLIVSTSGAQTRRTVAELRADHNAEVCEAVGRAAGCTQADVTAAVAAAAAETPSRVLVAGTIYTDNNSFANAVLLPVVQDRRTEERNNRASGLLNRAFQNLSPAKRVAVCTAAELPNPEICR